MVSKLKIAETVKNEVGSGVSELNYRYNCNYCQEDILGLRIKCAECPDFDLCLECFACGAQMGKHKNAHKYLFMNNGGFPIFNRLTEEEMLTNAGRNKRASTYQVEERPVIWNAREELRLLDAVEQYGYGNWKDITSHIETKTPENAKEHYIDTYIHGLMGKHTWKEELRGYAVDHTQAADRGPLSPTLTGKLPPIDVSAQEALLLGYMPHRDDFEDFDRDTELLVAQILEKSAEDEDLDVALKLAQCDIYERRLRDQVRRKRVARDYQLVSRFYRENPIVTIGYGTKISPLKISNQVKAVKKGDGPKSELIESFKFVTQFHTAQEFNQFVSNLCLQKEMRVRIKELLKYRENGLTKATELVPFEVQRFKRENKLRHRLKRLNGTAAAQRLLPLPNDFSLRAILNPHYHEEKEEAPRGLGISKKKRPKKSMWSRKKEKTGRRLLLQQGCILTMASPVASPARRESTDDTG